MNLNHLNSNLTAIKNKQDKNETTFKNNSSPVISVNPSLITNCTSKLIYDSGFVNSINEAIPAATTITKNLELPERANFDFSFQINTPEIYLPFLDFKLFTQPISGQRVSGIEKFTYSSLKEVLLDLYDWKGVTESIVAHPGTPPPPINCYVITTISGFDYINFKFPTTNFPVPLDDKSTLPGGSTTSPDLINWPNQKWENKGSVTFQQYMDNTGKTYAQAVAVFTQYYPEIFITPFAHGAPYKAYARVSGDYVENCNQKIKITKLDDNNFQINIYGYLLLVSQSNVETDFSDTDFPTYMPQSPSSLLIALRAYFKKHPVHFMQTKGYNK